MKRPLRLRGLSSDIKGRVWEAESLLRAGRLASLEIVLDDNSVSRKHAEVRASDDGNWHVRDLDSTNGTYVNGVKLNGSEQALKAHDIVQFGKVVLIVELADSPPESPPSNQHVIAATQSTFDDGIRRLAFDRNHMPRAGEQLYALLRAGHHFVHLQSEEQLLTAVLNDAVSVLEAQRGAIVLAEGDGPDPLLRLRALAVGPGEPKGRFHYSKKLTNRCFSSGVSLLYSTITADDESKVTQSIADGAMASVMCVLLRTPRKRLGVLHLDRSFWQSAFTEDDLHLADALAAHVSAAIESAQLLKRQKDQFLRTVTVLAQAVELRDDYTGTHTQRVTRYATMLGQKLELPEDQLELIRVGGPLHDIGKIGIDDAILRKPGKLTPEEFDLMKTHTTKGADILSSIPEMEPIIPIVRNHHEKWDGSGYPDKLSGENIPRLARIVAVADAFDAMTSNRPYHKGKPPAWAFAEVERQLGRHFDPEAGKAFLAIREEVVRTMAELMPDALCDTPEPVPSVVTAATAETGSYADPRA